MNFRQFVADQRRQDQRIAAELKLQEHQITQELKLKAEQSRKEFEQNAEQARKDYELKAEQSRQEFELRAKELELKKHQSTEELRIRDEKAAKELKLCEEELELKKEQYKEELRLKIMELEFKKDQSKEGVRLQEGHTKERQRLEELRVTEEIKIKDKEVSASVRLLEQQTQTAVAQTSKALKEAEALELKNVRNSKNRPLLADSDRRRVLARVFPKKIGAKCEVVECPTHVSAFSCSIIEADGYALGDIDRLLVVCPEHARVNRPRAYAVEHNRRKLETWLYRFGCSSIGLCALCGRCKLAVWHTETHMCHINAAAEGGGDALQNLVIGHVACNQQQGVKPLAEYHAQIRVEPELVKAKICVPEEKIEDAMSILLRKHKGVCKKCPVARLEAMLVQAPKRKQIQFTLDVRKTTTY